MAFINKLDEELVGKGLTKQISNGLSKVLITGVDQAAGTITLTSSSGVRSSTRQRLDFFIRQAPTNQ